MTQFTGMATVVSTNPTSIAVDIEVANQTISLTCGELEIGTWPLSTVEVRAALDGLHIFVEGEDILLETNDDARLALTLGVRNAPPLLRRKMAAALRPEDRPDDLPSPGPPT